MDHDEHLKWAKQRALEYVETGDLSNAVASMTSDLAKHEDFRSPVIGALCSMGIMEISLGPSAVRSWINGFN